MESSRETLRQTVASLSESDAAKALAYIKSLRTQPALVISDPSIHVPDQPFAPLPPIQPVRGTGAPASEILIRDRR